MVVDAVRAPYADSVIQLYLSSTTGMKYRTLNCMECGQEFLERQGDVAYRVGDTSQPEEIKLTDQAPVSVVCGRCTQAYTVTVSIRVTYETNTVPLYLQPESVYLVSEPVKRLRYMHCLECGKSFQSISDRISQMVDNRIPFEYLNPSRLGPIQRTCTFNKCGQEWALMV